MSLILKPICFIILLIGRGNEETKLKIFIDKNKITKFVKIIPFQKNPYKFIIKADLFILTSKFEGLPNVLLEAQSLKKYIISTNCPTGPREILENGKIGDLIKIGDHKKLSYILENFRLNKSTKKKIELGFKNTKQYDYKLNCLSYYNLIKAYL